MTFEFTWYGKDDLPKIIEAPPETQTVPVVEESVNFDSTQNLFIEGDSLEAIKLLQEEYKEKIKMIYIDPPYNTGNKDFIYKDDFSYSKTEWKKMVGPPPEDEILRRRWESGRIHSQWLNMMYPRLYLSRNLLREDGVIFISIDDNEVTHLRKLCDEIFGEENFVAQIVWAGGRKNDSKLITTSHEYLLTYARNLRYLKEIGTTWRQRKKGLKEIYDQYKKLKDRYQDNYKKISEGLKKWYKSLPAYHPSKAHSYYDHVDKRGIYFPDNISWPGGGGPKYEVLHPVTRKPVKVPSRGWVVPNLETMQQWIKEGKIHFGEDENSVPCRKSYLVEHEYQTPYSILYQDGRAASKRLKILLGENIFKYAKDVNVLKEFIELTTQNGDIILDFFAGSCTTAHAVLELNKEDVGNRKFIMVQLPEVLPESSEAYKAGYRTIADIGKERIRRVIKRIEGDIEDIKKKESIYIFKKPTDFSSLDLGFKVFKLEGKIRER